MNGCKSAGGKMELDPIVCMVSTYKEGDLVQGALRSLILVPFHSVYVCEGPTSSREVEGPETNLGIFPTMWDTRLKYQKGRWTSEADKRNYMLLTAKRDLRYRQSFWILTIDADEILLWGEYLEDWLKALRPGYPDSEENVVAMKHTQPDWTEDRREILTLVSPSRLVHSSLIGQYTVGLLEAVTPDGRPIGFPTEESPGMPFFGEPHIHHRHYLRRDERATLRGTDIEAEERARA
jgi:hypothetical protein